MATFAVGDIHGHAVALGDLLDQLRARLQPDDTVVFLGDYIDRGPGSKECVEAILRFRADAGAIVICLCGNHEEWLLRTMRDYRRHSWLLAMDAWPTIESYSVTAADAIHEAKAADGLEVYLEHHELPYGLFFDAMPREHVQFFETLGLYHETADCICAHAGLDPAVDDLAEQSSRALIWGAGNFSAAYIGSKPVLYGHCNNADVDSRGWPNPRIIGNTIGLDTIAHGVLTAMRMPDRKVFQSARYESYRVGV
jgi:serine/threonine protein phosphatase 1